MKKAIIVTLLFSGSLVASIAQSVQQTDISIFPKPEDGYKQVLIEVPHSSNDANKKIEFRAGKWMEVDACNTFGIVGNMVEKDLQGWGYSYYTFETNGEVFSTQMGCADAAKKQAFVSAAAKTVNYNGRLPLVIYVPAEFEVKFKIFTTDGDDYQAKDVRQ